MPLTTNFFSKEKGFTEKPFCKQKPLRKIRFAIKKVVGKAFILKERVEKNVEKRRCG
jgi:hypothetical protein